MRLTNIDDCDRELFYKQCGGKESLITVETAFNMLMALPIFDLADHDKQIVDETINNIKNKLYERARHKGIYASEYIAFIDCAFQQMKGEQNG